MKRLYIIGGPMGSGKTTVSLILKQKLTNSVFLDGDWCWDAHPAQINDLTKKMVIENICFLLNQFIHCPCYDHIIFCWVLHEQTIINDIISRLDKQDCQIICISLIIDPDHLQQRLFKDIQDNKRSDDIIAKSLAYLPRYHVLNTYKIDVSIADPSTIADQIMQL